MSRALRLAEAGLFTTHPNPRVGCVVVGKDGTIVGEAWHQRAGEPHAEVLALQQAGDDARDATAYVSLEPCCHQGRTPACTAALIEAGVARVVAAMEDPNPRVAQGGVAELRRAGIQVDVGIMREQAEQLNRGFVLRMRDVRPWITLKVAASIDGRTAMASGESRWVTGDASRDDVQRLRAKSSAILTGIGTVRADDPALTVRMPGCSRQPLRVIVDSHLEIDTSARLLRERGDVLICTISPEQAKVDRLARVGAEIVELPDVGGRVDLRSMVEELAHREVNELLVEAGPVLSGALLEMRLVDELIIYLAPHVMGDTARGMFQSPGIERLSQRVEFAIGDIRRVGQDLRLTVHPDE